MLRSHRITNQLVLEVAELLHASISTRSSGPFIVFAFCRRKVQGKKTLKNVLT